MAYKARAYSKFKRVKKKLPEPLRREIDRQVDLLCANPLLGEAKTGDLKSVHVHKFTYLGVQYLLAYKPDHAAKEVILLAVGGHENFYRDLKHYVKAAGS